MSQRFQCLVKAFDLALGLRVAGVAVLLCDAQSLEEVFKLIATSDKACCIDHAIIGEGGRWHPILINARLKTCHNVTAAYWVHPLAVEKKAGVV